MKTTRFEFEFQGDKIVLTGSLSKIGVPFPYEQSMKTLHNRFRVNISNGKNSIGFNWYDSHSNHSKNVTVLTEQELADSLWGFMMECIAADRTYLDFVCEFCYNQDGNSRKIYNACLGAKNKFEKAFDYDIYEFRSFIEDEIIDK